MFAFDSFEKVIGQRAHRWTEQMAIEICDSLTFNIDPYRLQSRDSWGFSWTADEKQLHLALLIQLMMGDVDVVNE